MGEAKHKHPKTLKIA